MAGHRFRITKNRIQQGFYPGFTLTSDGVLRGEKGGGTYYLFLRAIDSGEYDSSWGRLHIDAHYPDTMVLTVYAAAMNEELFYRKDVETRIEDFLCSPDEVSGIKKEFMRRVSAEHYVNQSDCLLYGLSGRYCYLMLEASGEGDIDISGMMIDQQGDSFMDTFPEIYREKNSFFHRYLSVFSTMHDDFQDKIDNLHELLDLDKCPAELLLVYARWLGIEVSEDFAEEDWLRDLVREAYQLGRIKGTKRALSRICEIVLGESAIIIEGNKVKDYENQISKKDMSRLYGSTPYDVTILIGHPVSEALTSKLQFILDQFKPVRCSIHIIGLHAGGMLDTHSYLDMNARVSSVGTGQLDEETPSGGVIKLS